MNKKGQALVEFIIVLPILIIILLAVVDYGNIVYNKTKLENILDDVATMYKNNESNEEINKFIINNDKDLKLDTTKEEKYINIKLTKNYKCIAPSLNKIFKTGIVIERKVYYE